MSKVNKKEEKIEAPAEVDEKEITKQVEIVNDEKIETVEQPKKKGRGRPRKSAVSVEDKKEIKPKKKPKEKPKVEPEPEPEAEKTEEIEEEPEQSVEQEKTINLKDIKNAIKNKVDTTQKKSLIKELLIYFGMAILMIFHLFVLYMGSKNIELNILINDMKIITLCILALGIATLEFSYKKDEFKIALRGLEVLVFGSSNLCLVYVAKLYFSEVVNFLKYIGIVIIAYYIVKIILTAIITIRKYKKDNNDIKHIVKKEVKR